MWCGRRRLACRQRTAPPRQPLLLRGLLRGAGGGVLRQRPLRLLLLQRRAICNHVLQPRLRPPQKPTQGRQLQAVTVLPNTGTGEGLGKCCQAYRCVWYLMD